MTLMRSRNLRNAGPTTIMNNGGSNIVASGKSTLIGLVMAFHYPNSGRVIADGHDLTEVRLKDYRSHLGVVMQDNFLFDGTISDNRRVLLTDADLSTPRSRSWLASSRDSLRRRWSSAVVRCPIRGSSGTRHSTAN